MYNFLELTRLKSRSPGIGVFYKQLCIFNHGPFFRDTSYFDEESKTKLKDVMLDITTKAVVLRKSKVILRKLFVAVSIQYFLPDYYL